MARFLLFLLLLLPQLARAQYVPDVLGDGYVCRTFQMADDYEGEVFCSLVKRTVTDNVRKAVLYVHGYNDYFFQGQLGDSLNAHGYNFYALDLRKYGRSMREHQDPFFCKSIKEYFTDLDMALSAIRSEGNERVWLMGHSTGGLITAYYLNHRQETLSVDGLILNSPFLDWNFGWFMEAIVMPTVSFIGRFFPNLVVQGAGSISQYAQSLLKTYKGEWEYDERWKMTTGHPKKAGWVHAIQEAQQWIQRKSRLTCPVLVLSSDKSAVETMDWDEAFRTSDVVLDVNDIQGYGAKLGTNVTLRSIPNGIHDLILSPRAARDEAYRVIFDWLDGK